MRTKFKSCCTFLATLEIGGLHNNSPTKGLRTLVYV